MAAQGTGGYPFLIQVVGYYLWREAEKMPDGLDAAASTEQSKRPDAETNASSLKRHYQLPPAGTRSSCRP